MATLSKIFIFLVFSVLATTTSFADTTNKPAANASASESRLTDVVFYSASWCDYCAKAKAYLKNKGIKYQEINIETEEGTASFAQAGGLGVPLLVVGTQHIQGFSSGKYDVFFANRKQNVAPKIKQKQV